VPVTIVDAFFDDPDSIRDQALNCDFNIRLTAPGPRALCPLNISQITSKKILALLIDMNQHIVEGNIDLCFQITSKDLSEGWVHTDVGRDVYFAGVVYLTPNAPLDGGTSIYKPKEKEFNPDLFNSLQTIKKDFYTCNTNNLKEFTESREKNNDMFLKTIEVSNVYNRLVMYPANEFHSENKLFGSTKEDSRLTLVFFVRHIASNSMLPIDRMRFVGE
jgi:hypothetical protein